MLNTKYLPSFSGKIKIMFPQSLLSLMQTIKIKPSFQRKVSFPRTFRTCLKKNMKKKWLARKTQIDLKFQNFKMNCSRNVVNLTLYCTWQGRESTRSAISPSAEQNLLRGPPPHLSQHHPRHFFYNFQSLQAPFLYLCFQVLL
jgi:hypothetical protein